MKRVKCEVFKIFFRLILFLYYVYTRSKSLEGKVNKILADAINPERSFMRKQWDSVGMPLLKGVLSTSEQYGSVISMILRIIGTLHGLYALQAIIDNVYDELVKKLSQIDEDVLTTNLILESHVKMEKKKAALLAFDLKSRGIDVNSIVDIRLDDDYEFSRKSEELKAKLKKLEEEKVADFLARYLDEFVALDKTFSSSMSTIVKSVSDRITEQIVRIIDSQLVSPWSTMAVSGLTDALSKRIQHYCLVDKNENSSKLDNDQEK